MKQFLDKDFLLSTDMAKTIYHDYAENMPILDYHCHINPRRSMKTVSLKTLPRYGLVETIINGVRCVQTVLTNIT